MIFKPLKIRNLEIKHPIFLAPLAGVTDSPFRRIAFENNCPFAFTEMVSARGMIFSNKTSQNIIYVHPDEKNIGLQLFGPSPEDFVEAIKLMDISKFKWIDINMGCPTKKIIKSCSGSFFLKDIKLVYRSLYELRKLVDCVLSAKIRLGWDREHENNTLKIARAVEDAGADVITIHGRYKSDTYSTPSDYSKIGEIKDQLSIPVIGNGDIFTVEDLKKLKFISDCDGAMIGRGILGKLWIFKGFTADEEIDYVPDFVEWFDTIKRHLDYTKELRGDREQIWTMMRKQLLWYTKGFVGAKELRRKLSQVKAYDEIIGILKDFKSINTCL